MEIAGIYQGVKRHRMAAEDKCGEISVKLRVSGIASTLEKPSILFVGSKNQIVAASADS